MAAIEDERVATPRRKPQALSGTRVLLEDPNDDVRDLIAVLLEQLGCRVFSSSPEDTTRARRLDLIVVEPASPSGRRLLDVHVATRSSVPVVCVSIYPRERVGLPLQPSAYLVKPFDTGGFQEAVLAALGRPS